jgi:hypothetical protein
MSKICLINDNINDDDDVDDSNQQLLMRSFSFFNFKL